MRDLYIASMDLKNNMLEGSTSGSGGRIPGRNVASRKRATGKIITVLHRLLVKMLSALGKDVLDER